MTENLFCLGSSKYDDKVTWQSLTTVGVADDPSL